MKKSSGIIRWAAMLLAFCCLHLSAQEVTGDPAEKSPEQVIKEASREPIDSVNEEATAQEAAAAAQQIAQDLERRRNAIQDMESDLGIYHPSLIEAYSDLGVAYEELEDYANAVQVYINALHVARVSSGLVSAEQLPVLEKIIEDSTKIEDYQSTDDYYHLLYHVKSRLYTPDDESFVAAVNEFGDWRLRVLRENLLGQTSRGLYLTATDLSDFYTRNIQKIENASGQHSNGLLEAVYGKSITDIEVARSIARTPYNAFQGTVSQYTTQTRCMNVRNTQGQVVRQCVSVQVENPRYRQSQRDAKQMALNRYTRAVEGSVTRMQNIVALNPDWPVQQKEEVAVRIRQLITEYEQMERASRQRSLLF